MYHLCDLTPRQQLIGWLEEDGYDCAHAIPDDWRETFTDIQLAAAVLVRASNANDYGDVPGLASQILMTGTATVWPASLGAHPRSAMIVTALPGHC